MDCRCCMRRCCHEQSEEPIEIVLTVDEKPIHRMELDDYGIEPLEGFIRKENKAADDEDVWGRLAESLVAAIVCVCEKMDELRNG